MVGLGANIRLFLGNEQFTPESFHPKLYLIRAGDRLTVFSGSSNLTSGGLGENVEQFEELQLSPGEHAAQMRRFRTIWNWGIPFPDATIAWDHYRRHYQRLQARRERLDVSAEQLTAEVLKAHYAASHEYAPREWHELTAGEGVTAAQFRARYPTLRGRRVAVTGRLPDGLVRDDVRRRLEAAGAIFLNDIRSRNLDLLIVGTAAGKKLPKAREAHTAVMAFDEARKLPALRRLRAWVQ
jgi:NAD-dependent DNA ligase